MKKNQPKIIVFNDEPKQEIKKVKPIKNKIKSSSNKPKIKRNENIKIVNDFKKEHDIQLINKFDLHNLSVENIDYCTQNPILVIEQKKIENKESKISERKNTIEPKEENKKIKKQEVENQKKQIPTIVDENIDKNINNNEILLEVINLRKQYNKKAKPAIDKLNFVVKRGQFHAFIGANGAGKTTTIKSIVGAYAKFEGKVKISGLDNREKMSKAKLGYIPEIARFPERISAFEYLKSMAMLNRLSAQEAEKFTEKILIDFKMYNLKNVSPNKFSSGQKKKILLAQALSNDPDILIMDEPAANLDPKARIDFFNTLKELQKQNKSIFISSHILSELDLYADSLTILDGGKIAFTGERRKTETHNGNKYAYRISLKEKDNFGKIDKLKFCIEQDVEEPRNYIISSNNKHELESLLVNLIENQKANKVEVYKLSIEDMYKKYVVLGSVHTGYKLNANYKINENENSIK